MVASFSVNLIVTVVMLLPLLHTGIFRQEDFLITTLFKVNKIEERHRIVKWIGVKEGEITSYENAQHVALVIPILLGVFSLMEILTYFVYLNFVSKSNFDIV